MRVDLDPGPEAALRLGYTGGVGYERAVALIRAAAGEVMAVYLFGSQAAGTAGAASDVDLAVLAAAAMSAAGRWELQERIACALGRDVDLIDLAAASAVMRVEVLRSATVLYEGDRAAREAFEAVALASYARLNEERRGILDDVRARGSVHG